MLSEQQIRNISDNVPAFMEWMKGVEAGLKATGLKFTITPATTTRRATSATWKRVVTVKLTDADGNLCSWFNAALDSGVSIADTSGAGAASIPSTTLTFVNGVATVVVTGSAAAWAAGTKQQETATVDVGVAQVETIAVTAACTVNGKLKVRVTAAGLGSNSPRDVYVDVTTEDNDTTKVATAIRAALNADPIISGFFTVGDTVDANVKLTCKTKAANDATLAIAVTANCGVTVGSSTDSVGGVVGAAQVETITVTHKADADGTLVFRVTSANVEGSPVDVNVPVTTGMDDATKVATAIKNALLANEAIVAEFTPSSNAGDVILTCKTKKANDGTLVMALADADSTGVTVGASTNTTAGDAPVLQKEGITITAGASINGKVKVTVTAANMSGSPKTVYADVAAGDTATGVATKIAAALTADETVGGFFTCSTIGTTVFVEVKTAAANDATMALAVTGNTGVTVGASGDTTAGVVPTITTGGNVTVTITSAIMEGGGKAINVAVLLGDTANVVAQKIRTALAADAAVTGFYTVGGTNALVSLTTKDARANDATLNIALADGTSDGVITAETSADTTAGVVAETNTVTIAQQTIQGATVSAVTSVETIIP